MSAARRRRFRRGEVVFHEGDPGDTLHLVDKGHFSVRITTPLGDVATLRVHGPGDFFGELAVISPAPRNATVAALDAAETLTLSAGALSELRSRYPDLSDVLMEGLVGEVRRLSTALVEALYVPVDKRVVRRLADLAEIFGADDGATAVIPLTQEEVAELAGSTRPTVNKILQTIESTGLIRVGRGRVEVLDRRELARRAR
jgi:CRP-like cAMP-binding protein